MIVKCPCGAEADCGDHSNLGERAKRSGFHPNVQHDGGVLWLCPTCWARAQKLAEELFAIVKTRCLYFPALLPK